MTALQSRLTLTLLVLMLSGSLQTVRSRVDGVDETY
jgi:hypothetical protein